MKFIGNTNESLADITSVVAGTGLSGGGTAGDVTLNVDAAQTQITSVGTITTGVWNGTAINQTYLTGQSGTNTGDETLSSINALDITEVGTIDSGVWNGTAIASAYLDADTAHLSQNQIFTGAKKFNEITYAIFDGDKSVTPGDGAVIHVDTHDVTDGNTSASGTAAMYTHVNIEAPRLLATNSSVTTTNAASLYIKNAPVASTNQTITNAYSLWVDAGLVKFDGALTVGGTITGDVTGDLTGQAATVETIAGLAPNTATTQATQAAITTCANLATVGTVTTGVWRGTAVESAYMASGTDSAKGALELATTGEADTGTDTARAVTPAGLKSHVDARYSYAYMTWSASGTSSMDGSDPEWVFPNTAKGIYEEDWTKDENIKATSVGTTTYTVTRHSAVNGLVIPHTGVCVGFHAHGRNDDNDATFKAGLFHLEGSTTGTTNNGGVDYGATGNVHETTLRFVATANEAESSGGADGTSSHSFKGPCKLVSNTDALTVSAGDVLLPAIMGPDGSDEIFVTMTIILKIPLTT